MVEIFSKNFKLILNYLISDLKKKKRNFRIGFFTVFLVVFFFAIFLNTIHLSPTILLRFAENQAGEVDIMMLPNFNKKDVSHKIPNFKLNSNSNLKDNPNQNEPSFEFLNFDEIFEALKDEEYLEGLSPRWLFQTNSTNDIETFWAVSNLIILDSKLENKFKFGRKMNLTDLGFMECYVSESVYKSLNLGKFGNILTIKMKLSSIFKKISNLKENYVLSEKNPDEEEAQEKNFQKKFKEKLKKYLNNPLYKDNPNIMQIVLEDMDREENSKKRNNNTEGENDVVDNLLDISDMAIFKKFVKNNQNLNNLAFEFDTKGLIREVLQMFNANSGKGVNLADFILNGGNIKNIDENVKVLDLIRKRIRFLNETTKNNNQTTSGNNDTMLINITDFLLNTEDEILDEIFSISLKFKVVEVIKPTSGKWPAASGNVIAIDSNHLKEYMIDSFIQMGNKFIQQ